MEFRNYFFIKSEAVECGHCGKECTNISGYCDKMCESKAEGDYLE